jgi:hypothetical protein
MKALLTIYLILTSTIGAMTIAYVFIDDPMYMLVAIALNLLLFSTYYTLWTNSVNKREEAIEEVTSKQQPIQVIGTRTVNYYEEALDIPTIDYNKPIVFDRAKAYYEAKKPI